MRKFAASVFFVLAIAVFVFDLYFSIVGAMDVNHQLAELAARGASGHELLGVGLDVLVLGCVLVSVVGVVFSIISYKIAQYRAIRIVSGVLCPLFVLPILILLVLLL